MIRYEDATDSPDERVDYPEIVEELRQLGFVQVGRVTGVPIDGGHETVASQYDESDAAKYMAHCDVPMPVLASKDGTTFADVSWFWDSPSVRLRTRFSDGALAETNRLWKNRPGLPPVLAELRRDMDLRKEMALASAPDKGRSIEVVDSSDTSLQWDSHRQHIARYGAERNATPVAHHTLDDAMAIMYEAFGHDIATQSRTVSMWRPLLYAYLVVGLGLVLALAFLAGQPAIAVALAVLLGVASPAVVRMVLGRVQSTPQRFRPPLS
ncbi:MAG: hypothetical protein HKN91_16360 [Acidimicrobiia bacterium]|nr:hypothetical protein [Acidimicrobiia bacterium]